MKATVMKKTFAAAAMVTGTIGLTLPIAAFAQTPTVEEVGHLTAAGTGSIRKINLGRNHYQYTEDYCKVLEEGTQTLIELRTAADNAILGGNSKLQRGLDKVADELKAALDAPRHFSYYYGRCHPPGNYDSDWSALSLGTYLIGLNRATQVTTERSRTTDTGQEFHTHGDPPGIGFVATYLFAPGSGALRVGPFASFDILRQTVNHDFAGGRFLGTTTHWFATTGLKAGAVVRPDLFIYGLTGASWLNEDLNVNFATASSSNVTIPGVTVGLGAEYRPSSWQVAGHPVTLFAQYQHTWWSTANFNAPASSPGFNYAFRREDDTLKLGVNFYFAAAPPTVASSPTYPVKAPASK